jgi:acyl-coenzyme A thioesterase PaaI-like protein
MMPEDAAVLTVEFKTNLIAPACGDHFLFRARVVKPGRTITVCEAQAFAVEGGKEKLVAREAGADPGFKVFIPRIEARHPACR